MNEIDILQVGNIYPDTERFHNRTMGRVYDPQGLCPTINSAQGGGRVPLILDNHEDTGCNQERLHGNT